jgi:putative Mn2+ efflux pump MntP
MLDNVTTDEKEKEMSLFELFILAVGLSMDAFAVSICKGLAIKKINLKKAGIVGLYFGLFQAGMPLIGYTLGVKFQSNITVIDHWIAFVLLVIIGANMIKESLNKECEVADDSLNLKNMLVLAIATSIDALAVGVTFAFLKVDILPAVSFIGIVTFILAMVGVKIGNVFGTKYKSKAEFAGGIILILMGIKILFQHLGLFA